MSGITPIVLDIETAGLENAAEFIEPILDAVADDSPIEADKRLTDAVKIAADLERKREARAEAFREAQAKVEQKRQERLERAALDWNVGRIAALGYWTMEGDTVLVPCASDRDEAAALTAFWSDARHRTIVGFNVKGFDLRFMVQRSRYLGVPYPMLDFSKYSRKGITDLYLDLTFGDGTHDQGVMRRTLHGFCKRFGIPVNDALNGADIPKLVAAGEWDQVMAHLRSDIELTRDLAIRLGVIAPIPEPASAVA